MPIPVTKYRCQFKCGKLAMGKIVDANRHESVCVKNPENKTCETCCNKVYRSDGDYIKLWYRGCKIKLLDSFFDEHQHLLEVGASKHIKAIFHCPNHNIQTEVEGIEQYIEEVSGKLKQADFYRKGGSQIK